MSIVSKSAPLANRSIAPAASRRAILPAVLCVILALPLATYASVGAYARYTADDYCWAGILRAEGFFRAQMLWYTGYSPRYAFTFLVNVAELAGPAIVPFLPTLAILVWVGVLAWMFRQLDVRLGLISDQVAALLLAELVALAALATAPDLAQSLYWQTGMLTYLLPLVLMTAFVGWVARAVRLGLSGPVQWLVSLAITYVAGGLSETYLIPQNVALSLAVLVALLFRRDPMARRALPLLVAGLAGGVLALVTIVVAPSTALRVGGPPANLWLASAASIATAFAQVLHLVRYFPHVILLCLALPGMVEAVAGPRREPPPDIAVRQFLVVTAAVAIVLPFCFFASFYAQNGNPPARSLIVPGTIVVGYLVYLGVTIAPWLALISLFWAPVARAIAVAVLMIVPVSLAATTLPDRALAAQYAVQWDAEDAAIRAASASGVRTLVVPPLPRNLGEGFVTTDPKHFFNVCVARYYNLDSIAATADS